jgi:dUTP pyrophosphatase
VLYPIYVVSPENQDLVPVVAHPGEDAGADIRACINTLDLEMAEHFFKAAAKQGPPRNRFEPCLYINGENRSSLSERDFIDALQDAGNAVLLPPGATALIDTGFRLVLPDMSRLGAPWCHLVPYYQIVSRSGLAHKHGIVVTNAPGIVDYGYRDFVKVSLTNRGNCYHVFTRGARIAQGIVSFAIDQSAALVTNDEQALQSTERGLGGFGSTSIS